MCSYRSRQLSFTVTRIIPALPLACLNPHPTVQGLPPIYVTVQSQHTHVVVSDCESLPHGCSCISQSTERVCSLLPSVSQTLLFSRLTEASTSREVISHICVTARPIAVSSLFLGILGHLSYIHIFNLHILRVTLVCEALWVLTNA